MSKFSLVIILFLIGCADKKSVQDNGINSSVEKVVKESILEGFSLAKIELMDKPCGYALKISDKYYLPLSLETEFEEDGKSVYVKFVLSRRAQGDCTIGQPITISEIINVEE